MIVSKKYNFVFTAIPKTGTRTICRVLMDNYDAHSVGNEHGQIMPVGCKDMYSFVVTRNPYDRAISMWWSTCVREQTGQGKDFKKYANSSTLEGLLKWMITLPESSKNTGSGMLLTTQSAYFKNNKYDKILSFENLQDDFNTLPFLKNSIILPRLNSSSKVWGGNKIPKESDYTKYLTPAIIDMINLYYEKDFELLTQYEKLKP